MPAMIFTSPPEDLAPLQADIAAHFRADETQVVKRLLDAAHFSIEQLDNIAERARALVVEVRKRRIGKGGLDAFLHEYECIEIRPRPAHEASGEDGVAPASP